ncbi:hypothetical protein [Mycobacterium leprae]|uniref:hypothetical protein n=1 Tax=Mycobacterium leprae TaxID=1769 RepID=UPI000314BF9C|nr:hypothetical protein [Mycobacterium leprae]OAR21251.1 hypothetical protein A8144_07320 [Mycobacterium leprae 3125609]OAX71359.1 hypothetical protein A3216_06180 [Mycobacterium leprae 7935681]
MVQVLGTNSLIRHLFGSHACVVRRSSGGARLADANPAWLDGDEREHRVPWISCDCRHVCTHFFDEYFVFAGIRQVVILSGVAVYAIEQAGVLEYKSGRILQSYGVGAHRSALPGPDGSA